MDEKLRLKEYLRAMTVLAQRFDVIVAEPVSSARHTYIPAHGNKLYWDTATHVYMFMTPEGPLYG